MSHGTGVPFDAEKGFDFVRFQLDFELFTIKTRYGGEEQKKHSVGHRLLSYLVHYAVSFSKVKNKIHLLMSCRG